MWYWVKKAVEPEKAPPLRATDYVQCVAYQSAECALHVGGIYRIETTDGGKLQFRQCGRDHDPRRFLKVPFPSWGSFLVNDSVCLSNVPITDHVCNLVPGREYKIGDIDDFKRVYFFHQGCDNWHDQKSLHPWQRKLSS